MSCAILAIPVADYADLGRLTAQKRDGRAGAVGVLCRKAKTDAVETRGADKRLPVELPRQLLDAIQACMLFGAAVIDLGLTSNQVWGFTATDEHWAAALGAALIASGRDDLKLGTNAVCQGWVCSECRAYQCIRMDRRVQAEPVRGSPPPRAGSWNQDRLGCGRRRWSDG
jgi:hypothetical protein